MPSAEAAVARARRDSRLISTIRSSQLEQQRADLLAMQRAAEMAEATKRAREADERRVRTICGRVCAALSGVSFWRVAVLRRHVLSCSGGGAFCVAECDQRSC